MKSNGSNGAGTHATDPLRTLWDRLDAGGYEPHGEPFAFRARCPAHDGTNREALSVSVGADGRALAHCHAHDCDVQDVTAALGLDVCDLFPAGHKRARRVGMPEVARRDFKGPAGDVAHVLYALEQLDLGWRCELAMYCPACGDPAKLVASSLYDTFVSCPNFCTAEKVAQILAGKLADQRRVAR
jgi:hypothetical protein